MGVSFQGVSVQGDLCPGGSLSRGVSVQGVSLIVTPLTKTPRMVKGGPYASYWNAFLFEVMSKSQINIHQETAGTPLTLNVTGWH